MALWDWLAGKKKRALGSAAGATGRGGELTALDQALAQSWLTAAADLGIRVQAPFVLPLESGPYYYAALVLGSGYPQGAKGVVFRVVDDPADAEPVMEVMKAASDREYTPAVLPARSAAEVAYDRGDFMNLLNGVPWCGAAEDRPDWHRGPGGPSAGSVGGRLSSGDLLPDNREIVVADFARDCLAFVPQLVAAAGLAAGRGDVDLANHQVNIHYRGCYIQVILTALPVGDGSSRRRWQLRLYERDRRPIPDAVARELADCILPGDKQEVETAGFPDLGLSAPGQGSRIYYQVA